MALVMSARAFAPWTAISASSVNVSAYAGNLARLGRREVAGDQLDVDLCTSAKAPTGRFPGPGGGEAVRV